MSEASSQDGRLHWDMTELLIDVIFEKRAEKIVEMAASRSVQFASLDAEDRARRRRSGLNL